MYILIGDKFNFRTRKSIQRTQAILNQQWNLVVKVGKTANNVKRKPCTV